MKKQQKIIKKAWVIFIVVLVITLGLQFFMHPHGHFKVDSWVFFNAVYGFLACAAIIVVSKWLGYVLKRPENYYEIYEEGEK